MNDEKNMVYRSHVIISLLSPALILFLARVVSAAPAEPPGQATGTGIINGKIMIKEEGPMQGGQVLFFRTASGPPPSIDTFAKPPDFTTNVREDGTFMAELPEGVYYLKAVKRISGARFGPPRDGDFVHKGVDEQGNLKEYRIETGKAVVIETALEAVPLRPKSASGRDPKTGITGTVLGVDGKPVVNAVVIAFGNPAIKGQPLFVSRRTDARGRYVLVAEAGTYYLRVREDFGTGRPEAGQMVGYYGDEQGPLPVMVNKGSITDKIDLKMTKFPGAGPAIGNR